MILKDASQYLRNCHTLPWASLVLSRRVSASCIQAGSCTGSEGGVGRHGSCKVRETSPYCVFPPHMTICLQNWAGPRAVCLQDVVLRSKGKREGRGRATVFMLKRAAQNHWQADLLSIFLCLRDGLSRSRFLCQLCQGIPCLLHLLSQ